jgi:hypothetical protein
VSSSIILVLCVTGIWIIYLICKTVVVCYGAKREAELKMFALDRKEPPPE